MFKKLLMLSALLFASSAFSARQIELAGPKDVVMRRGWTSWVAELPQPIAANQFRVLFWNNGYCQIIPTTSISIKYKGIQYWSSTEWRNGAWYGDGTEEIVAIKLDMYQDRVEQQMCIVKVSGFIP